MSEAGSNPVHHARRLASVLRPSQKISPIYHNIARLDLPKKQIYPPFITHLSHISPVYRSWHNVIGCLAFPHAPDEALGRHIGQ